jgi:hypothetical protein
MVAILESAADPADLMNIADASVPYRFDRIFSAKGFGARRLERKRLRLMKELDATLNAALGDGEKVEFVTWGVQHSLLEQFMMGVWATLFNRRAFVFTSRRLLMIQISSRRRVGDLKMQIRYPAIERLAKGGFGAIALVLRNGRKYTMTGIPRKDRKAVRALVGEKIKATRAEPPGIGVDNLCPRCTVRVMDFPARCKQCTQPFKSARRAGWLSLAFPGLGDVYLGHRWLGASEMLGGAAAWMAVVAPVAWDSFQTGGAWFVPAGAAAAVFAFVHGTDSWITRRMGFKGLYPDG